MDNTQLLIIDPQNDFCDIPGAALPVTGANADMRRTTQLLRRLGGKFDAVHVTLDSHNPMDIAHPGWWKNAAGESPAPFTLISVADVDGGVWQARDPKQQAASLAYVKALAERGRHQLIIWPEHCLIGSWGNGVHAELFAALGDWARAELKLVNYVSKGTNPLTEHYSAIQAEVPSADDDATQVNAALVGRLARADTILVAGEALSHCVASTVRDLADQLGADNVAKLVLLTDCTSPVTGFEAQGRNFIEEMVARGMRVATSHDIKL
ncbi:MAG: isochorismatase family protein [Burkholderiales bacterium]|nr:isochorismatase family protein [Burkholderiales bacterium]